MGVNIVDNILLTIPFGFGINFLARVRPKGIFWLAPAVGLGLELAQLCISLLSRSGSRASDINDAAIQTRAADKSKQVIKS